MLIKIALLKLYTPCKSWIYPHFTDKKGDTTCLALYYEGVMDQDLNPVLSDSTVPSHYYASHICLCTSLPLSLVTGKSSILLPLRPSSNITFSVKLSLALLFPSLKSVWGLLLSVYFIAFVHSCIIKFPLDKGPFKNSRR